MTSNNKKIYFITGSQTLYGEATLQKVAEHAKHIAKAINDGINLPVDIEYRPIVKSPEEIAAVIAASNADSDCIGLIIWMHTFSPAKMWINGLHKLQLPLLHLHTQFNRDIPFDSIDMDFMNLNQSAHGDREMAHLLSKMSIHRKIVVGHWSSSEILTKIDRWSRLALGMHRMKHMKIVRFGDNMRYVSVTDGDKVSAEMKFGFSVNTHGVGDLVKCINAVEAKAIDHLLAEYEESYMLQDALKSDGSKRHSLYDAAKIELGIRNFLEEGGYHAYTNTFEDLHGMNQLPGIGSQRLMQSGYGFGAEGDWKTAGLLHVMKYMAQGMKGGNSFMEDYTYHFDPQNEMVLGSHMLEICPSIADGQVQCEVHPLGIGGKEDPVRLVFNASKGPAVNASLVDMGDRFRLILNKVEGLEVTEKFPQLPTARALWRPYPSMEIGLEAWLLAGGAHHTVYSQNLDIDFLADFGEMLGIETLVIDENTNIRQMKETLKLNSIYYSFNK
jgi:L-arabinose isomerase